MSSDTGGKHDTLDRYIGADGDWHRRLRLTDSDMSPTVIPYPPQAATRMYHPKCSGCWFGRAHSVAYHDHATDNGNASW